MEQPTKQTTKTERTRGLSLLFVCLLSLGMGQSLFFALLPPIARDLGLSEVQVSAIFTLSAVLWVVMSPFWGRRSDIWGRKPVILLGLVGFGISTGGFGLLLAAGQTGVWPLMTLYVAMILVRAVFGFFGSGTPSAAQAYIADRTTRSERTSGVAAIGAAFGMGTIVGPGFAAAMAAFHLLAPFFALAVFCLGRGVGNCAFPARTPPTHDPPERNAASQNFRPAYSPVFVYGRGGVADAGRGDAGSGVFRDGYDATRRCPNRPDCRRWHDEHGHGDIVCSACHYSAHEFFGQNAADRRHHHQYFRGRAIAGADECRCVYYGAHHSGVGHGPDAPCRCRRRVACRVAA